MKRLPPPPPVEAVILFDLKPRKDGPPRSRGNYEGERLLVIVGEEFERWRDVKFGETWKCRLWKKATCLVAEPLARIDPPDPEPPVEPDLSTASPQEAPAVPHAPPPIGASQNGHGPGHEHIELVRVVERRPRSNANAELSWDALESLTATRVALFLHGPDLEDMLEEIALDVEWGKLRELFVAGGHFIGAFLHELDVGDQVQHSLHDLLARDHHYTIRVTTPRSPAIEAAEDALERLHHEFALDGVTSMPLYDVAYLFTSSARFVPLIRTLQGRGKRVFVVSSRNTLASELALAPHKPLYFLEDLDLLAGGPAYE